MYCPLVARISQHALLLWGGGVPASGGVPAGRVGVYLPGGLWGGVPASGGVPAGRVGGYLPGRGTCQEGVPARGVYLPVSVPARRV